MFTSLKSIRRKTLAVFRIISNGVKNPSVKIPEIKPLRATPAKTGKQSEKVSLKITFNIITNTTLKNEIIIAARTISTRRTILRTIIAADMDEQIVKSAGIRLKLVARRTPSAKIQTKK